MNAPKRLITALDSTHHQSSFQRSDDQRRHGFSDVTAVFFRAALLLHLFQSGLLDDWRKDKEPAESVFRVGAIFPIEQGVEGFDPVEFIERLRSAEA